MNEKNHSEIHRCSPTPLLKQILGFSNLQSHECFFEIPSKVLSDIWEKPDVSFLKMQTLEKLHFYKIFLKNDRSLNNRHRFLKKAPAKGEGNHLSRCVPHKRNALRGKPSCHASRKVGKAVVQ